MKSQIMRLFLIIVALFSVSLWGQDTWVKTYTPFEEEWVEGIGWIEFDVTYDVEDILVTQDGGFLVSGAIDRTIDDDPPHWWDHWGFLMKTDCDGNLLWADADSVSFMGENDNYAIVETSEGDYISLGYALWGGGYMIKRDCNGNRLWDIEYTDFGANSMYKTNDGNIILGGVVSSNIALRKIDNDGNTIWTKSHDCGTTTIAQSITQTQNSDYILTGTIYYYDAPNNIIVLKTDANGDSLWTRTYEGFGFNDKGTCIIETFDSDIIVGGFVPNYEDYLRGYIWKLDQSGNTLWDHYYEEGPLYYIISAIQSSDNSYVLQGGRLVKIDEQQNILWNEEISGSSAGEGDRNLQELPDGGFVCVSDNLWRIYINRTDENGQVDSDDNTLEILLTELYNFPNPFNPATTINYNFGLGVRNPIMEIYNIKGQRVRELNIKNEKFKTVWDGSNQTGASVSSGVYFYRIKGDNFISETEKMILMK